MSAQVIPIETNTPHRQGMAICRYCGRTWRAVAPAETVGLDCPSGFHSGAGEFIQDVMYRTMIGIEKLGCSEELTRVMTDLTIVSQFVDATDDGGRHDRHTF